LALALPTGIERGAGKALKVLPFFTTQLVEV
jgi:hypothetical protein